MPLRIETRRLLTLLVRRLEHMGFDAAEARAIGRNLWEAELSGRAAHGVARLALLSRQVSSGQVRPVTSLPIVHQERGGAWRIDARGRSAWLALPLALKAAAQSLRSASLNVTLITLHDASPGLGYLGQYGRKMASRGLALLMMVKSTGGGVPHLATTAAVGTNPICFAAPGPTGPLVLDMATTAVSWNEVELARVLQQPLPEGVAFDGAGLPTEDPQETVGLKVFGGHKGTGLAIMVDVLAGALGAVSSTASQSGRWGVVAVLVRADVRHSAAVYLNHAGETLNALRAATSPGSSVRYPGSEAHRSLGLSLERGWVNLDPRVMQLLDVTSCEGSSSESLSQLNESVVPPVRLEEKP